MVRKKSKSKSKSKERGQDKQEQGLEKRQKLASTVTLFLPNFSAAIFYNRETCVGTFYSCGCKGQQVETDKDVLGKKVLEPWSWEGGSVWVVR
jgi:hypothetical protein